MRRVMAKLMRAVQRGDLCILIAVLALILVPVHPVLALQCYSCSSLQEPNCWNVSLLNKPQHVLGCDDQFYACSTRVTTMRDFAFIGRSCLPKRICEETINIEGQIQDLCATCETDLCNTGSGANGAGRRNWMESSSVLVASLTLVAVFRAIDDVNRW